MSDEEEESESDLCSEDNDLCASGFEEDSDNNNIIQKISQKMKVK